MEYPKPNLHNNFITMAMNLKLSTPFYTIIPLLMILFSSPSLAATCDLTPYPTFCRTSLPLLYNSGSVNDQALFFLQKSLSSTKTFVDLISSFLTQQSIIPDSTLRALQDCHNLVELNNDFLSHTIQTIQNTPTLSQVYDLHTLLSAILTNHQTCLDGFKEVTPYPAITRGLLSPLSDGTKLFSTCLALFTQGWLTNATGRLLSESKVSKSRKLFQKGVEGLEVREKVVVKPDGSGDFTTINDAIMAAPNNTGTNNGYYVIYVVAGIYNEYVSIPKNKQNLMIIGDGINQTIITGNRSVVDGWTTFQSATLAVSGPGFVGVNLTIRNTAGAAKHQAVALRSGADMSAFYNSSFEGYQDTLYTHSLRQFYKNCDIYGTVDFIFGNAAVVLQDCNIYPTLPMENQFNAITAQGRIDPNQNTGISLHNCNIRPSSDLAAATYNNNNNSINTYLGRPWKEYSRTVYMQNFMDSLIDPKGWNEWSGDFALTTLYYAEYNNWGPGSNTSERVTWPGYHNSITEKDARAFTVSEFIQGDLWLPKTAVPYQAHL